MPSTVDKNLPPTNEGYGTQEYWEQRYSKYVNAVNASFRPRECPETSFDWFLTPTYLLPFLEDLTKNDLGKETRILMLGCGNSALSEVMYDAGWHRIVNLDYSPTLIEQMKEKHIAREGMTWLEMDVLDLKFTESEFDLVLDKGTMDAMLTSKGDPWNPPEKDIRTCTQEVAEALRVLRKRKGSKFVYFTFGQPHFRKRYMQDRPGWKLYHREIGPEEGFAYFMYVLEWIGDV